MSDGESPKPLPCGVCFKRDGIVYYATVCHVPAHVRAAIATYRRIFHKDATVK